MNIFFVLLFALSVFCQVLFLILCIKAWRDIKGALIPALVPAKTRPTAYDLEFVKSAYLEARPKYMARENVRAIGLKNDKEGYFFKLTLRQPDPAIGGRHEFSLSDGTRMSVRIKTTILGQDKIKAHSLDLSGQVFDVNDAPEWGTVGCLVRLTSAPAGQLYFLTCCHNVIHPSTNINSFTSGSITAGANDPPANPLGPVNTAIRDHEIDAALIAINATAQADIVNTVPGLGGPKAPRTLYDADTNNNVSAFICGAASGSRSGIVTGVYDTAKIQYDADEFQLTNLITVSNNGSSISQDGDSGSVVLDNANNVLGLVVAGQPDETYILPIDILLTRLNIQLA